MIKVRTSNDSLLFNDKDEVINYFDESLNEEPKDQYFDDGCYWLEIEGEKIRNWNDWKYWKENE